MATLDGEAIFVDANILIYSKQQHSPFNETATRRLEELEQQEARLWVSGQILREYLAAMSRQGRLTKKVATPALLEDVRGFAERFRVAGEGASVTERLFWLLERVEVGGKQVHDANIVATMLEGGVRHLLTHNVKDFERFEEYVTVLPLTSAE